MKKIIIFLSSIIFAAFSISSYAEEAPAANGQNAQPKEELLYCPKPEELTRSGPWWRAGEVWKSYNQSFVEHIQEFSGAQWIGVKVGKIICLYKGAEKLTFPVALETVHPVLVPMPTGDNWTTTKEGYKQCISDDVMDCPFTQQKPEEISDVYKQIQYQAKPQNNNNGN
jgi:hypothetical protein